MPDLRPTTHVRLGIFGYGFIAKAHMAGLRRIPQAEVVGVCGPHRERAMAFASEWNIPRVFQDPDDLLSMPNLDAVIVDAPDAAHASLTLAAAHAGKHVFCEKPLAVSLDQARHMEAAIHAAGLRSCMGFSNRWNPTFLHVKTLINAGEVGDIRHVHAQAFNAGLTGPRPSFGWRSDAAQTGAGILGDLGAHMVDLIRFLAGNVAEVCAQLHTYIPTLYDRTTGAPKEHQLDDDVVLLFRLANGAQGTLSLSRVGWVNADYPVGHRQVLIDGSKAGIAFENGKAALFRSREPEDLPGDERHDDQGDHLAFIAQGAEKVMRTFLGSIEQGVDLGPTIADGLRCQEVLDAAIRSSRERRWVTVAN